MGLEEKRVLKSFQEEVHPELVKKIQSAAKFEVEVDVHWETLMEDGYSPAFQKSWTNLYYLPTISVLEEISKDDLGAEAIKESLKKIVFKNTIGNSNKERAILFENGILVVDHKPFTNVPDPLHNSGKGDLKWQEMQKALFKKISSSL